MVEKHDIEMRDFSIALPEMAAKVKAIATAMINNAYSTDYNFEEEDCLGFGSVLAEVYLLEFSKNKTGHS